MRAAGAVLLVAVAGTVSAGAVETLKSVGGLPAHIAGAFEDLAACQQSPSGDYVIFDRRAHTVYRVPASADAPPREIVGVGFEPGRVLRPTAFDFGSDDTFVVADAPFGTPRLQLFHESGMRLGGFSLAKTDAPLVTLQGRVVNGVASVEYSGRSLFVSQPETGALINEYSVDGQPVRSFGTLRATGQEHDPDVHVALNTGIIVVNPRGGFFFVFLAGVPAFRKYDNAGTLAFERQIQGVELDAYVRDLPGAWPRKKANGEIPLVVPSVRAAAADPDGNLWISLAVPYTYVYDAGGEKRRTLQFAAAGPVQPTGFFFTRGGRVLVTPGCYAFPAR
jgi:hypothetical protein